MNILYIDGSPLGQKSEDYSIKPNRYGGGGCAARFLKMRIPNFTIAAKKEAFDNYGLEDYLSGNVFITIPEDFYDRMFNREPLKNIFLSIGVDISTFDLVMTGNRGLHINLEGLKAKYVSWATGGYETVSDTVDYLLTYNDHQFPQLTSKKTKVGRIVIGKPIPNYQPVNREDFIFQCTAMRDCFSVQEVVNFCELNKIKGIFAGPKGDEVKFGQYSKYVGEITEDAKMDYLRKCRLTTLLHKGHTCFSLSAVEALSVGTPVACYPKLFWPEMIGHGFNGYFIEENRLFNESLLCAYESAKNIDNLRAYWSSFRYSEEQMSSSFIREFINIMEDIKISENTKDLQK